MKKILDEGEVNGDGAKTYATMHRELAQELLTMAKEKLSTAQTSHIAQVSLVLYIERATDPK